MNSSPTTSTNDGPVKAFASGPAPYRTLLVGAPPVAEDAVLGDSFARDLADRTGHGVDVEGVVARPLAEGGRLLTDRDLSRIDAVVVVVDADHGRHADHADAIGEVARGLTGRMTAGAVLTVVVPPPAVLGMTAPQTRELADAARARVDQLTPVVLLEDETDDPGVDPRSARWARTIAAATATGLIDPMVRFLPDDPFDEDLRLDAVDLLPARDGGWASAFQQIVDDARLAYGTTSAAMSIIDADHTRYGVTVGFPERAIRRGQTICNRVLRTYGGLIVGDAQQDLRFQRNPDVRSGDVRFYAGYRIEAVNGAPLGSLCVFDPEPRGEVSEADLIALRDLALAAQERLWSLLRAAS